VSGFDTVVGRIRRAMNSGATQEPTNSDDAHARSPVQPELAAGELRAQFAAALTAVGGHPIEAPDEAGAIEQIAALLHSCGLRSAALGAGITTDSASAAARLSREGFDVTDVPSYDGQQTGLKEALSSIDAGIVEADYGIGPTGTLVMIAHPARPRSLSLLPPINIVLLRTGRILPNLAAALRAVGPQTIAAHPMVMVTGPSRTADIEKRIVIGVHGPKELYVIIIPDGPAAPGSAVTA